MFSIVVVYNNEQCLNEVLLPSLKNQTAKYQLIPIDNTKGQFKSATEALNHGRKRARGKYIVFVHQDVIFSPSWLNNVLDQISIVNKVNSDWGVLGVYGVTASGRGAGHIVDRYGHCWYPPLPREVQSLDEVCLITRKESGLCFDEDLGGFHLYGADLCLQAAVKGLTNFAIDACVQHLGRGKIDTDFWNIAKKLYNKWKAKDCPIPVIETTCGVFRLQSGINAWLKYRIGLLRRSLWRRLG